MSKLIDELMEDNDVDTSSDIATKGIKDFKRVVIELIEKFNLYIKLETKKKDIEKKDIKKKDTVKEHIEKINTKENSIEHDANNKTATSADIKAHIIDKQKLIKQRYKSLLETKKTIKNNIDLVYTALIKLPNESQPKLTELLRLDTILNDSINVIWREIYERDKKGIKKIDVNKIKYADGFIHQLKNIVNNKNVLLKKVVIVKLNGIISELKEKSLMDDVYNYDDIDKLFMINNDLDKYMKYLKKDIRSIKTILKTISANQTDSRHTLINLSN